MACKGIRVPTQDLGVNTLQALTTKPP